MMKTQNKIAKTRYKSRMKKQQQQLPIDCKKVFVNIVY